MPEVTLVNLQPRILAAARRSVRIGEVAGAVYPALDEVWTFLKTHPGLHAGGHNVFLYEHPQRRSDPMQVDFGVEVTRVFPAAAGVAPVHTPSGRAARALHVGPYAEMMATHEAIHYWCAANGRRIGSHSLEIYGDYEDDPAKLETEILYLLA